MRKIAIFHFNPVELFPPVMNLVNYLAAEGQGSVAIRVYTRHPKTGIQEFIPAGPGVRVFRIGADDRKATKLLRYLGYFRYYLVSLISCLVWKPGKLLYIETFSSLTAWLLKKRLGSRAELYIHYHEYMSPEEYAAVPMLNWLHRLEKRLYPHASWVSHTNEERMRLFRRDIGQQVPEHIMPNFPPASWSRRRPAFEMPAVPRFVYVGAIDLESMYFREFASWIEEQGGRYTWHIYSHQSTEELKKYLDGIGSKYVHIRGGVDYYRLPDILSGYEVGVILYKGTSLNFMHNAPNKLFEYLACDLDVWLPSSLVGAFPYLRDQVFPKVIALDLSRPEKIWAGQLLDRRGLHYAPTQYFCETAFFKLGNELLNKDSR